MTVDVLIEQDEIKIFPATELEEIIQNVRTIIGTLKGTCPLYREFGIDARALDMPILAAQAKITAEITSAVSRFEPRAQVSKVFYSGDAADGKLGIQVRLELVEKNLRGGI